MMIQEYATERDHAVVLSTYVNLESQQMDDTSDDSHWQCISNFKDIPFAMSEISYPWTCDNKCVTYDDGLDRVSEHDLKNRVILIKSHTQIIDDISKVSDFETNNTRRKICFISNNYYHIYIYIYIYNFQIPTYQTSKNIFFDYDQRIMIKNFARFKNGGSFCLALKSSCKTEIWETKWYIRNVFARARSQLSTGSKTKLKISYL